VIELENVYKLFGPRPAAVMPRVREGASKETLLAETGHTLALRDVTLAMPAGRTFVVMGLSGSGKSTLLRLLNRLIEPTAGAVRVDGTDVLALSEAELTVFRRRRTSMVFQRFGLFPHRTVLRNVAYGLAVQGTPRGEREARARRWVETVGLAGYENAYPVQLSGGMQQRVGLARALATDPDILLMDEPFGALDPLIRREMQDELLALQAKLHKTIAFITHDLDEALRLGDRIAIIRDGEVVQVGTPAEILLRPASGHVAAFVRDVNRGRVLTAAAVMSEPTTLVGEQLEPGVALGRILAGGQGAAYVLTPDRRLRGVLTAATAERAARAGAKDLYGLLETVPTVSSETVLEALLPLALESAWPLAVVDESGALLGVVRRSAVLASLANAAPPIPSQDRSGP